MAAPQPNLRHTAQKGSAGMPEPAIDVHELRQALGAFATGVTIVTTRASTGAPVGLTANSFNSVSLDPPLVLWSLALASNHIGVFRAAGWWAVHILSAGQQALSARFASRVPDRFEGVKWAPGEAGVPLIAGCTARFVCRTAFEYEGGDHAIFVGQVAELTRAAAAPLIYHSGRYAHVMPETEKPAAIAPGDEGEFGRHFIGHLLGRAHHEAFAEVRREYRARGLHAAEYTVLVALGLGDGHTPQDLIERAARGGADLPQEPIDALVNRGLIRQEGGRLHLTPEGRRVLMELIAVAQASQLRLEGRLEPQEMGVLIHLLRRLSE
jgi:3-hydroxy-9,10-secoandrosta-1,3,5(10)-triene-9,17-dione monooxygenase reductase component